MPSIPLGANDLTNGVLFVCFVVVVVVLGGGGRRDHHYTTCCKVLALFLFTNTTLKVQSSLVPRLSIN